jgi:2Fe-2S ferredoxin
MLAAKAHAVPGLDAECGGSMVCGTCHVFVDGGWFDRLPAPSALETELISYGLHADGNSRLSCQIVVTDAMEGMSVEIPPSQR